jgi:hypothetical protein
MIPKYTKSLKPIEGRQSREYLTTADFVFQEKGDNIYTTIKDRVNHDKLDCDLLYIETIIRAGRKVCIVSASNEYYIVLTNIIMEEMSV